MARKGANINNPSALGSFRHKPRTPVSENTAQYSSLTPEGILQNNAGVIYFTETKVTDVNLSTETANAITEIAQTTETAVTGTTTASAITAVNPTSASYVNGLTTTFCEACEEIVTGGTTTTAVASITLSNATFVNGTTTDTFVTEVTDTTDAFLTSATLTKTTEDFFSPVLVTDGYGNLVEMVRSNDDEDVMVDFEKSTAGIHPNLGQPPTDFVGLVEGVNTSNSGRGYNAITGASVEWKDWPNL